MSVDGSPAVEDPREVVDVPLASTRGGRRLIDVTIVVLLFTILVSNLPDSALEDRLTVLEQPVTDLTGLHQNWALFAPSPRSTTLRLRAEIERTDGTVESWVPPVGDRLVGVYRTYRWRKWANGVVDPDARRLHRGAASYLQHRFTREDAAAVAEVRLYRGTFRQPGTGSGQPTDRDPPFEEELIYRAVAEDTSSGDADAEDGS